MGKFENFELYFLAYASEPFVTADEFALASACTFVAPSQEFFDENVLPKFLDNPETNAPYFVYVRLPLDDAFKQDFQKLACVNYNLKIHRDLKEVSDDVGKKGDV